MKKLFFTAIALVVFSGASIGSTTRQIKLKTDCGLMASELIAIHEEFFGCLEAEDYNFFYTNLKSMCEGTMPISGLIKR